MLASPMNGARRLATLGGLMLGLACGRAGPAPPISEEPPPPDGPLTIELPGEPAREFATRSVPAEGPAETSILRRHPGLEVDPCLRRAAGALAAVDEASPADLPLSFTELVLHWAGCADPTASLSVLQTARGDAELLVDSLDDVITAAPATHIGVAGHRTSGGSHRWIVLLVDRRFWMAPVPAAVEPGSELPVQFTLAEPFSRAELIVTLPRGEVVEVPIGFAGGQAVASVPISRDRGRQWVELIGTEASGPRILALFPLAVGVEPPTRWAGWRLEDESRADSSEEAEEIAARMIRDDRRRFGLPELERDGRLDDIARAHSREMADADYFAHISPTTGTVVDRLRAAGYRATYASENIARSRTVAEAHHGLMRSPGHRAAILSADPTLFGVGAVLEKDRYGEQVKILTQIFVRPPPSSDPDRLVSDLAARIIRARTDRGVGPLLRTEALDRCAASAARAAAADVPRAGVAGTMSDCVTSAVGGAARHWRLLSGLVYEAGDVDLPAEVSGDYQLVGIAADGTGVGDTSGWAVVLVSTSG